MTYFKCVNSTRRCLHGPVFAAPTIITTEKIRRDESEVPHALKSTSWNFNMHMLIYELGDNLMSCEEVLKF